MSFHHQMMQALDKAQQAGALLTPLHVRIRAALRAANMRGRVYTSAEELAADIAPKAWGLSRELKRAA